MIIRERGDELARLETLDTGKPIQETLVADWPSGADALEWFAGLAPTVTGETIPLGRDFVYTLREPLGVCVGIGDINGDCVGCVWARDGVAAGILEDYLDAETGLTGRCVSRVVGDFEAGRFTTLNIVGSGGDG